MRSIAPDTHICYIVGGRNEFGGVERHLVDLVHEFTTCCKVSVLADESFRRLFDDKVNFQAMPLASWRFNPWVLWRVFETLNLLKPSLIHVHSTKAARVIAMLRPFLKTPSVLTVHNNKPVQSLCAKFDAIVGVTSAITDAIDHPTKLTILNGRD